MAEVTVEKLSDDQISAMDIKSWPIWEKEASTFDWTYGSTEQCLLLAGKVTVKTDNGEYSFGAGDFVTFEAGLNCIWTIHEDVSKHYKFL